METTIQKAQPRLRRFRLGQLFAFGAVIGVMALFAVGIVNRSAQSVERGVAPPFSIPMFSGGTFSLAEQRGKVVVVNFWASWCIPCRDEAPMLERVWRKYKDRGVVFVGVAYADTENGSRDFIKEFNITYPNGPDIGTQIVLKYKIKGVPETFFVARMETCTAIISDRSINERSPRRLKSC